VPPLAVTARYAARRGGAGSCCGSSCRTAHRRSSMLQGNGEASVRTREGVDRVHGGEAVASPPLQPGSPPRVEMDALRKLHRDGGAHDAAAAVQRCSDARSHSGGSCALQFGRSLAAASLRSPRRRTCCRGRTGCRRRPTPCNRRRRTRDGCPRRREIAIEDWTRVASVRDTAPSRRRGLPCRLLKEARPVVTPVAGLPSCTGLMVAAPCSDTHRARHARTPAASAFTAVARNKSQELRCPETESESGPTAGIRRVLAAVYNGSIRHGWPPLSQ
jgi:hypothetical protein